MKMPEMVMIVPVVMGMAAGKPAPDLCWDGLTLRSLQLGNNILAKGFLTVLALETNIF